MQKDIGMFSFKFKKILIFLSLFLFSQELLAYVSLGHKDGEKSCIVIAMPSELENVNSKIKDSVPQGFIKEHFSIKKLTFSSDIEFDKKEFLYLVGFKEGDSIGVAGLKRAVACLIKKNKFEKIMIAICPQDDGKHLHFELMGSWIFRKIKVSGIWVGRHEYSNYYTMDPGDKFNIQKHNHAINKLKDVLKLQGYFNANVIGDVQYDKASRSVYVDLFLDRKKRFSIDKVACFIESASDKKIERIDALESKINSFFAKNIVGNSYSKSLINKETRALKRYLSKKGFLHVDIQLIEKINYKVNKVDLRFIITLHYKKEFIFFGNNFFDTSQLLDKILLYGRSAWLVPGSILSGELIKEYKTKGFWDIKIETKQEDRGYFFVIKEGERAKVKKVQIKGVNGFDSSFLIKSCFSKVLRSKFYDQILFDQALSKLLTIYLQAGFWDIKILKHSFEKVDKDSSYKLVISLDEGQKSYLKSISIVGIENSEAILKMGPFGFCDNEKVKVPFDIDILAMQKNWLLNYFKDQGYLHVDLIADFIRQEQDVSLVWTVDLGKLVTFGKTIILGVRDSSMDYIIREMQYKEGDPWSNQKLKESVDRLRTLGIFNSAHLFPNKVPTVQEQKDVLLKINNSDPYEVRARVGLARYGIDKCYKFGQGFTYKLGGAFLWKNPLKKAGQFIVDFDVALSYRNFRIDYCLPWIFGYPVKTTFKVYANRYEQPGFICSKKNLYQAKQDGFLVGLNRVYKKLNASFNFGIEFMETSIKRNMISLERRVSHAINFDSCLLNKKIPYLLIEPTVLINTVDNKKDPRAGFFTLMTVKAMLPLQRKYTNSSFVKFLFEQSIYYSLLPRLIGALRVRLGHIFFRYFKDIAPIERFYLGGAHSVRGYEKDMCPPLGIFCDKHKDFPDTKKPTSKSGDKSGECMVVAPQGAKTMVNINVEARFNFYQVFSGVLFQDLGILVGDKFNRANVSPATGFGLRYNSMIGPLRFDIGFKWRVRNKFESRYAWYLAFGNAF